MYKNDRNSDANRHKADHFIKTPFLTKFFIVFEQKLQLFENRIHVSGYNNAPPMNMNNMMAQQNMMAGMMRNAGGYDSDAEHGGRGF